MWYPERPPISHQMKTVYNRQREHLNKLALRNQKKKEIEVERQVKARHDVFVQEKISEQVLNRMASERLKKANKIKSNKPVMTPFQEAIHEHLVVAKEKLDEVELIDEAFAEELEDVESDLTKTGLEKAGKNPGKAIGTML